MSKSVKQSMSSSATLCMMRCVTVLSLLTVDLDLVATLLDLVVEAATLGQVELWETMVLLLPPPAVKCPDKSARMFPARSAEMCQELFPDRSVPMCRDKSADRCRDSSARMFPGSSARMFLARSARMCQDKWQGRSAPMFQDSNAKMFLASNARMFPVKRARTFPDRSARMCPVSSVSRWL